MATIETKLDVEQEAFYVNDHKKFVSGKVNAIWITKQQKRVAGVMTTKTEVEYTTTIKYSIDGNSLGNYIDQKDIFTSREEYIATL